LIELEGKKKVENSIIHMKYKRILTLTIIGLVFFLTKRDHI